MTDAQAERLEADIRAVLDDHAELGDGLALSIDPDTDLWACGMTSRASVSVMVALEDHFGIEFPDELLGRETFGSIERIGNAVSRLTRMVPL